MSARLGSLYFLCLLFAGMAVKGQAVPARERICGKWESLDKDLIIQVFIQYNQFRAKLLWYSDTDGEPLDYWTDIHNPNPELRSRKLLCLSVLRNLTYNPDTDSWENGTVYDSKYGREWKASAYIGKKGLRRVRGYWHFKFIGRTM